MSPNDVNLRTVVLQMHQLPPWETVGFRQRETYLRFRGHLCIWAEAFMCCGSPPVPVPSWGSSNTHSHAFIRGVQLSTAQRLTMALVGGQPIQLWFPREQSLARLGALWVILPPLQRLVSMLFTVALRGMKHLIEAKLLSPLERVISISIDKNNNKKNQKKGKWRYGHFYNARK